MMFWARIAAYLAVALAAATYGLGWSLAAAAAWLTVVLSPIVATVLWDVWQFRRR
jgi:hypothetical protein